MGRDIGQISPLSGGDFHGGRAGLPPFPSALPISPPSDDDAAVGADIA